MIHEEHVRDPQRMGDASLAIALSLTHKSGWMLRMRLGFEAGEAALSALGDYRLGVLLTK